MGEKDRVWHRKPVTMVINQLSETVNQSKLSGIFCFILFVLSVFVLFCFVSLSQRVFWEGDTSTEKNASAKLVYRLKIK